MKIAIIGSGVSGVSCSIKLKMDNMNNDVYLFEKENKILKKLLQTGNGKCNIFNTDLDSSYYNDSKFMDRVIESVPPKKYIKFLNDCNIFLKTLGNLYYPQSESSQSCYDGFLYQLNKLNVNVRTNCNIENVYERNGKYIIDGIEFDKLVIAIGSYASVKNFNTNIFDNLNIKYKPFEASLCALKLKGDYESIKGVKVKCEVTLDDKHTECGEVIFKEDGINGIVVMNLSRFAKKSSKVKLNFVYNQDINDVIRFIKQKKNLPLDKLYEAFVPYKFATYLSKLYKNPLDGLTNFEVEVVSKYDKHLSQVNMGGVETHDIDSNYKYKHKDNLYIIGECINIDGKCGGYNLYHAISSGILCANSINTI